MNRKLLLIVVALASASAAHAQSSESQLSFSGRIVQQACNPGSPLNGLSGGMAGCGAGVTRALYAESVAGVQHATGVAMLDYFVERQDGGSKYVVMREYR